MKIFASITCAKVDLCSIAAIFTMIESCGRIVLLKRSARYGCKSDGISLHSSIRSKTPIPSIFINPFKAVCSEPKSIWGLSCPVSLTRWLEFIPECEEICPDRFRLPLSGSAVNDTLPLRSFSLLLLPLISRSETGSRTETWRMALEKSSILSVIWFLSGASSMQLIAICHNSDSIASRTSSIS
jgi:hypothetical protein